MSGTGGVAPASLSVAIDTTAQQGSGCFAPAVFSVCQQGYGAHTICAFTYTNVGVLPTGPLAFAFTQGADGGYAVELDQCTGAILDAGAQCLMEVIAWTESAPGGHTGALTVLDTAQPLDDAGLALTTTQAEDAGCFP